MARVATESKKSLLIRTPLGTPEFDELRECSRNIFAFSRRIRVVHPTKGAVPFKLYPYQVAVLKSFLDNRFNIILKFRQAGLTELIAMFCLWYAMYHRHRNVQIISIKERTAKRVLRRIKFMYEHLPDHLKTPVISGRGDDLGTSTEMEFSNGSIITSIPTTEEAGRSEAASLLVIDEAAIIRWASIIWASAFPTLSTGGRAIVNSTPYGIGNWYHRTWVGAMDNKNGFIPIRLFWWMHPERDQRWYNEQLAALGPRRTAQEIDGDFLGSGHSVFDLTEIRDIEDYIKNEVEWKFVGRDGELLIAEDPRPQDKYFIGADVATGRSRDHSTFSIYNQDGDEFACYKGKISPSKFADMLAEYGEKYNRAMIAPESNDIGLSTAERLQAINYPNLYYSKKVLKRRGEGRHQTELIPGWYTNQKTRPLMISRLEEDIRQRNLRIINPHFCLEAQTFIYDATNRPVAMGKDKKARADQEDLDEESYSDDAIIGEAITNYIRKAKTYGPLILPQ